MSSTSEDSLSSGLHAVQHPPGGGNPTPSDRPKTPKCCHTSVPSSTLLCPCLGGSACSGTACRCYKAAIAGWASPAQWLHSSEHFCSSLYSKPTSRKLFFLVVFFFSRVFLPVSQNEMYLISVLGLLPLQRLCAHSRKACFIPCVLTMRQTITLCYTGNLRCFTFFSSFWHYSVHFIGI